MDCRIWNPTITRTAIVDSYTEPSGLVYVSNSSLEYWQGRYWAAMDGTSDGFVEGSAGQQCWMTSSQDGDTWEPAYQPFRDPDYTVNPVTDDGFDWQPNLVAYNNELWCIWSGKNTWVSVLSSPTGKWTNHRVEFQGTQVFTSTDVDGAPAVGMSLRASFNGVSDWLIFPTQNPIILNSGDLLAPVSLRTPSVLSTQSESPNEFIRQLKFNGALRFDAKLQQWSLSLIDTSLFGDWIAWEPFFVENPAGHVYGYTRSLDGGAANRDMLLVAVSTDGGRTFTASKSSQLEITSNRAFAKRVSDRRWVMVATDTPQGGVPSAGRSTFGSRVNGSVFVSRRGSNDFAAGINFSDSDAAVNYPQCTIGPDDELAINYTSGTGNGIRRSMQLIRVSPLPSDDYAYVHPRTVWYAEGKATAPELVEADPPYYQFSARNQLLSETSTDSGPITFTAWGQWGYGGIIIDNRAAVSPRYGLILTVGGLLLGELNFLHGAVVPPGGGAVFIAASISPTTVTVYAGNGESTLAVATGEYRTISIDGNPEEADTLTVDGTVYTFTESPTADNDVQIAATLRETLFNLRIKLGRNAVKSAQYLTVVGGVTVSAVLCLSLGTTAPLLEDNQQATSESFTVSTGSDQITVTSGIPLTPGKMSVGYSALTGSSLTPFDGKIFQAQTYSSALTAANIRHLYNSRAEQFGYPTVSGTTTEPPAALLDLNADDPDTVEFPPPTTDIVGRCDVVDEDTLDIFGEGSASVELPYGPNDVVIRWKLGATPTGADKYVIATFGTKARAARLFISGAEPTKLYLNDRLIATVSTPTEWQTTTLTVSTGKVTIGDLSYFAPGKPRCFLGNAYPEGLLASSKSIRYDVSEMSVSERINEGS
jgi:hypothetical protein